jgi:hypothetical protein
MLFENLIFAWFLVKFDQNTVNNVKEIAGATSNGVSSHSFIVTRG